MSDLCVSIIMPTYNRGHLIERAINSVLSQMEPGDELIVIDDGSTDNTEEEIAKYGSRIKYIKTTNWGAGKARNLGIRAAQNDLIAFLDSDDEWMPGKLGLQKAFMRACPDLLFCFTDLAYFGEDGQIDRFTLKNWPKGYPPLHQILSPIGRYSDYAGLPQGGNNFKCYKGDLYAAELMANYVTVITLMVRRNMLDDTVVFAEDTPTFEDWEWHARLARKGQGAYLECETAWQHGHPGPRLTDANRLKMAESRIKIIERVWGQDKEFLARNKELYHTTLRGQYLIAAHRHIAMARPGDARRMLKKVNSAPLLYRLLAYMPGSLLRLAFYLKRGLFNRKAVSGAE